MAEVELPPDHGVDIDGYAAVVEVQRVLKHLEQGPHGDLACNAERAAFIAVYTLRQAGLMLPPGEADTEIEYASEHTGHGVPDVPDPFIQPTGADRGWARIRVETWQESHPHARHRVVRRVARTTYGAWEDVP